MAEEDEEDIVILACSSVILSTALLYRLQYSEAKKASFRLGAWLPETLRHNCLMKHLRMHDADKLRNYLRMELPVFEELFSKVEATYYVSVHKIHDKSCVHKLINVLAWRWITSFN